MPAELHLCLTNERAVLATPQSASLSIIIGCQLIQIHGQRRVYGSQSQQHRTHSYKGPQKLQLRGPQDVDCRDRQPAIRSSTSNVRHMLHSTLECFH